MAATGFARQRTGVAVGRDLGRKICHTDGITPNPRTAKMTRPLICLSALTLAACQTVGAEPEPLAPPPYPPGYAPAGTRLPDIVTQNIPADVVPQQVLIADDGCYYYHRGPRTYPITNASTGGSARLCVEQEPVGVPVDLSGVSL